MIFRARIKFIDDGVEQDVSFSDSDGSDDGENIFYYGVSLDYIIEVMEDGTVMDGEWKVIEVYDKSLSELEFQAEYEATKDDTVLGKDWTPDYREGFVDGLNRAIEIIKGESK